MLKLMPVPPTEKNGAVAGAAWPGPRTSGTGCEEPGIAIVVVELVLERIDEDRALARRGHRAGADELDGAVGAQRVVAVAVGEQGERRVGDLDADRKRIR